MSKNDSRTDKPHSQVWDLIVAGSLLTRLPLPHAPLAAFDHQARAVWAYPIWGLVIGGLAAACGAVVFALTDHALISAGAILLTSILITGAMHEDGLADCADGFWGGYDPKRRLEIMKDSQIGTYGVLALVLFLGLRWIALAEGLTTSWGFILTAAVLSRSVMPLLMIALPHARANGLSHSVGRPPRKSACIALGIGIALAALFSEAWVVSTCAALAIAMGTGWLARAKIKGQTGDTLGATQMISETAILILLVT